MLATALKPHNSIKKKSSYSYLLAIHIYYSVFLIKSLRVAMCVEFRGK